MILYLQKLPKALTTFQSLKSKRSGWPTVDFIGAAETPAVCSGKWICLQYGDVGLIPGSRRSLGEGNGYLLQYACLEIPRARGAWWGHSPWGRSWDWVTAEAQSWRNASVRYSSSITCHTLVVYTWDFSMGWDCYAHPLNSVETSDCTRPPSFPIKRVASDPKPTSPSLWEQRVKAVIFLWQPGRYQDYKTQPGRCNGPAQINKNCFSQSTMD